MTEIQQNRISTKQKAQYVILVVDADVTSKQAIITGLDDEDWAVLGVADGQEALTHMAQLTKIDLMIINMPLPAETDFDICSQIRAAAPDLPILAVTSLNTEESIERVFQAGATDCMLTPLNFTLLRQRIYHHLKAHDNQVELRRSEERYRVFSRMSSDYVYEMVVQEDGTLFTEMATPGFEAITGYELEAIQIDGWREIIHPEDTSIAEARHQAILGGQPHMAEFRIKTCEGETRWLRDYALPVIDENTGQVIHIYGIGHDATKDKQTETALQESRHRLELALEASEVGIWDWDMTSNETYFSPRWVRMLGYEPEEIENRYESWRALIHPDDWDEVNAALQAHIEQNIAYELEHRLRTKAGRWLWVLTRGRIIERGEDGRGLRMVGTHRNIHQTKMMQDALAKSEERHRIISNTISDFAYSYIVREDGSLKKDWSTQAFHDITGYSYSEVDSNGWLRLIHPDDMPIAEARFKKLLAGEVDVSEFRIKTKSGEVRWLRDHGYPVIDPKTGDVTHIYGAAQDITQRKRDEEALRRQALELKARNEELDAFAYTVAHDLKNPISSMMGFASLMETYYERMSPDQVHEYLQLIMEGGYKLKEIINALLLLAGVGKMDEVEVEPLDMHFILEESKKRLAAMIDSTSAKISIRKDLPTAAGYGPWVEEIWMNYISNALKYGGQPPEIEIGAEPKNGMVRYWVRDNGRGLTPEEQTRVFTPFTRLNQVKIEGHGLGLSVVQRIVHKMGGEVGVESEIGQGSVFSFTLPNAN